MFRVVLIIGGEVLPGVWFSSQNWTIEQVQKLQKENLKGFSYYLEFKN